MRRVIKPSYFIILILVLLVVPGCTKPSESTLTLTFTPSLPSTQTHTSTPEQTPKQLTTLSPTYSSILTPTTTSTPVPTFSSDKVIRLYYYGPSTLGMDPAAIPGTHCIYSATSSDGINFKEDSGVRFSYDTNATFGITDPDIVRLNDGSWLMFTSLGTNLVKAVSFTSSGIFSNDKIFSWNRGGVSGSYNFDGVVRTFVCYQGGIHMATYDQKDGVLNYSGIALNPPISGIIADPSVIQIGKMYLMFYKYAASPSVPPTEHEIYLAISTDGVKWSQHTDNKFVGKGSVPGAIYYNGVIYVYYCGLKPGGGGPKADMGVAISRDDGATFSFSTITITGKASMGAVDPSAVVVSPAESTQ